ncbi:MAG: ATP-binding protein [Chromatiaceae bacterium]
MGRVPTTAGLSGRGAFVIATGDVGGSYRLPFRRLFWVPIGMSAALVLLALAGLAVVAWRGMEGIRPLQTHLHRIARIQDMALSMEQTLLEGLRGAHIDPTDIDRLRLDVTRIAAMDGHMHPETPARLAQVAEGLDMARLHPVDGLVESMAAVRQVLAGEREYHRQLLDKVAGDTALELRLAVALLGIVPLAGGGLLLVLRARIKHPLDDLGNLLGRLAARDYRPVAQTALTESTALVQPVLHSYNELVCRLQDLEADHRARQQTLQREVRKATEALLAQSRELARAERLAAVGAVSAGLAHELRNPLAGIQMACGKLRRGLTDPAQLTRVESVINELKRLSELLTVKVDAARHEPEVPVRVHLQTLVNDLLSLTRYQAPPGVALVADIPDALECVLPAAGLRQALLNLVLNAIQVQDAEGRVTLRAHRQDHQLVLEVEDEGPGFPEETLRAGVRPFATGRIGGTGLGLAIVRRFTRDHGGELELGNRQPHGARVTLRLACAAVPIGDDGAEPHA